MAPAISAPDSDSCCVFGCDVASNVGCDDGGDDGGDDGWDDGDVGLNVGKGSGVMFSSN